MIHTGGKPSRADDVEEIDFLLTQHQGVGYILAALGAKPQSIARNMERYGRKDLARMFRTQSTLVLEDPGDTA